MKMKKTTVFLILFLFILMLLSASCGSAAEQPEAPQAPGQGGQAPGGEPAPPGAPGQPPQSADGRPGQGAADAPIAPYWKAVAFEGGYTSEDVWADLFLWEGGDGYLRVSQATAESGYWGMRDVYSCLWTLEGGKLVLTEPGFALDEIGAGTLEQGRLTLAYRDFFGYSPFTMVMEPAPEPPSGAHWEIPELYGTWRMVSYSDASGGKHTLNETGKNVASEMTIHPVGGADYWLAEQDYAYDYHHAEMEYGLELGPYLDGPVWDGCGNEAWHIELKGAGDPDQRFYATYEDGRLLLRKVDRYHPDTFPLSYTAEYRFLRDYGYEFHPDPADWIGEWTAKGWLEADIRVTNFDPYSPSFDFIFTSYTENEYGAVHTDVWDGDAYFTEDNRAVCDYTGADGKEYHIGFVLHEGMLLAAMSDPLGMPSGDGISIAGIYERGGAAAGRPGAPGSTPGGSTPGGNTPGDSTPGGSLSDYMPDILKINPDVARSEPLFFERRDMDNDGYQEIVLAFGEKGDDDDYIYESMILREKDGKLTLLEEGLAGGGYSAYKLELARFAGEADYFLIVYLTNYASLHGIQVLRLSGDRLVEVGYSASGSGTGGVSLTGNAEGRYDGYTEYRWSYDVLYHDVEAFYRYRDGRFVFEDADIGPYAYGGAPKDAAVGFMALCLLWEQYPCDGVEGRLTALCGGDSRVWAGAQSKDWGFESVYYHIMDMGDDSDMTIEEAVNGATARVTVQNKSRNAGYRAVFEMRKGGASWQIQSVSYTPAN